MKNKLELSKKDSVYLSALPEQGMGYQIVIITLRNGQILNQRIVVNSTYLLLNEDELLQIEDIVSVKIDDKLKNK